MFKSNITVRNVQFPVTATLNNVNRTQKEINLKVNPLIKKNFQIYTTILMFDTVYYSYHE